MNKMQRLLAKVDLPEGCWIWKGSTNVNGYGRIRSGRRGESRTELAHRAMWEAVNGPIIGGMQVLHHCDTPPCVRPDHLYLGTPADNMFDRDVRGRARAKLNADKVRLMRKAAADGWTLTAIAEQFGVSVPTAHEVVRRKSWQHVE